LSPSSKTRPTPPHDHLHGHHHDATCTSSHRETVADRATKAPPSHHCTPPRPEPRAAASGAIATATAVAGAAAAEANRPRPTPQVPARRPPGHSSGHPQGGTGPGRPETGATSTDGDPPLATSVAENTYVRQAAGGPHHRRW
jgi:hypothetical protein